MNIPHYVIRTPRRFWRPEEVEGGIDVLDAFVAQGELLRLHEGIYWRGVKTRFGMTCPTETEWLRWLLPFGGWGYSEYSAANKLGFSTQVPFKTEIITPISPIIPWSASEEMLKDILPLVNFTVNTELSHRADLNLTVTEVSILEIMRQPEYTDIPFSKLHGKIKNLLETSPHVNIQNFIKASEKEPTIDAGVWMEGMR